MIVGGDGLSRMGSSGTTRGIPGRSMGYKLHFGRSRITDDDEYDSLLHTLTDTKFMFRF